jgi:hopanoid biosynthesis associated radical SAM protein HpnJ
LQPFDICQRRTLETADPHEIGLQLDCTRMGKSTEMMKTLFLHPPSFDGFDGGAGARYQAKREIKSFWFPTWLAQPAALVEGSKLIDAPPARISLETVTAQARDFELCVMHTSTPSFASDVRVAQAMKDANPALKIGFVGAKVAVQPTESLQQGAPIDFVARNEFDFSIKEVAEGRDWKDIDGLSFRDANGGLVHNKDRTILEDMDQLPFVTEVYKRDLRLEDYFIGYLKHPYISIYTGRGCKSHCTFCLWPQTVGGHRYRVRSPEHVAAEIKLAMAYYPQLQEVFFDDDTFTDNLPRAEAIARELGKMGVTWSCNAKANVPRATLKVLKDNGLRLLLVGYETGNQQILYNIKKGMRIEVAKQFTKDCHELGIKIHGTFIMGLPGETQETIQETIRFAQEINPHTLQVSLAAPYPGTFLYKQAVENGWLDAEHAELIDDHGVQIAPLHYPHLSHTEIFNSVEEFYKKFYFRAPKIASIVGEMVCSPQMMKRRLREGVEFFQFLRERNTAA